MFDERRTITKASYDPPRIVRGGVFCFHETLAYIIQERRYRPSTAKRISNYPVGSEWVLTRDCAEILLPLIGILGPF